MTRLPLLFLFVFFASPLYASGNVTMQLDYNYQRPGGDYTSFWARNADECARQCENSRRCKAFDFHSSDNSCWLKSYAYSPRYYRGVVSGVKQFSNPHDGDYYRLVRTVQEILTDLGYRPGYIDGRMGRRTRTALRNYQYDNGLPPTGELDPPTLMALGLLKADPPAPQSQQQAPPPAQEPPQVHPVPQPEPPPQNTRPETPYTHMDGEVSGSQGSNSDTTY
ncbi:peptidoglycan-binding protein [Desulfogranum japonicum]|uniref:peptidoglycan-binding protein n=1 Tax=Desulfogranum japonicum TaxID=231447 RepID=UPI0004253CE8|nr:peptidoglycan-binding protein [Desulfogranum japonicum]